MDMDTDARDDDARRLDGREDIPGDLGRLVVTVDFKVGTSRERLMEILEEVLYRPDVVLSDSMPLDSDEEDWYGLNKEARFSYEVTPLDKE